MGEKFDASVQYGDLSGTVSIDGYETGGPLHDLAEHTCLKPGYWPVGFGLHGLDPTEDGKLAFVVFGVDGTEVGTSVDDVKAYVSQHGKLPVVGFHGKIESGQFIRFFKRFSLRVHSKHIGLKSEELDIAGFDYGEEI